MDALSTTALSTRTNALLGSAYKWSNASHNHTQNDLCRTIKVEDAFEIDHRRATFYRITQQQQPLNDNTSDTIPLASCATAAASLSSAFCRRSNSTFTRSQQQQQQALLCYDENEGSACGTTSSLPISNVKCEQASPQHSDNCSLSTRSEDSLSLNNCYAFNAQQQQSTFSDAAQMDIYRDLILRHLIQDISTTCAKLALPTDPYVWTAEHSARWISEMCMQFQLHAPRALFLSGRVLLAMNQEEFMARAPDGGDTLHAQLQLWKTAFESYTQQQNSSVTIQQNHLSNSVPPSNVQNNNSTRLLSAGATARDSAGMIVWPASSSSTATNDHSANSISSIKDNNSNAPSINATTNRLQNNTAITPAALEYVNNFDADTSDTAATNMAYYSTAENNNSNGYALNTSTVLQSQSSFFASSAVSQAQQIIQTNTIILASPSDSELSSSAESSTIDEVNVSAPTQQQQQQQQPCIHQQPQRHTGSIHLWHFIRELLDHPKQYSSCVRWVDRDEGTFKIESSHHLARFWGQRKNRAQMNYDKLSRSLRQYYKKGIIQKPEKKQRLVYKFLPPYNL